MSTYLPWKPKWENQHSIGFRYAILLCFDKQVTGSMVHFKLLNEISATFPLPLCWALGLRHSMDTRIEVMLRIRGKGTATRVEDMGKGFL